ncbi:uncharacterized protein MONOS_7993 [Monocercomonoides exilis]|uniref:uncharacterized protein n=1 Tax=Monocercomonoides exilis TaxID=2049356 RepID=UPI00355A5919|nr:hypothetical protein MONOS_7993 [Monocercomonoides exilis]|eukprot:MONOS_7993.1-p1 / transcript=MONOS_7993.1 / gene=MONOS_7993 / organism=Monocercomonoides_exilis_PA203 / gene_product=unspecified product / transcript_product=unspecified product / location=Mono_scaffold00290:4126-5367(-) / protein_length=312 / sequence_SO=supercontig / SO=protein_coding / is_pseudo=false
MIFIVPCLLKVSLQKEESEETQKEVETALLALSCIPEFVLIDPALYLNEITEIILYHQEHRNLSRLAYQSAWGFLKTRLLLGGGLDGLHAKEMHFVTEAANEQEELSYCVDWMKKEKRIMANGEEEYDDDDDDEERKEEEKISVIKRWLMTIYIFLFFFQLSDADVLMLTSSVACLNRKARVSRISVSNECLSLYVSAVDAKEHVAFELMRIGAGAILVGELQKPTLHELMERLCLKLLKQLSRGFCERVENEEARRKLKMLQSEMCEMMEEEGFYDTILSLKQIIVGRIFNIDRYLIGNEKDYDALCFVC